MSNWIERDAASIWHGFTQMRCYGDNEPVIVERGEGRELIDVHGKRYFDAISSLWVTTLGHRVPALDAALQEQLGRIAHSTLLGNGNRIVIEFAEALARVVPVDGPHTLFASDGATAVEQALKIAFQYWVNQAVTGKTEFLAFGDAYHGDTVGAMSLGDGGFGTNLFDALRFKVMRAPSFKNPRAIESAVEMIERHGNRLAAVVVEPRVQGAAGMQMLAPEKFATLADACRRYKVLLICDEVATGFGRTGTLFASTACGLRPDILCLGKGITGGYLPMSATIASRRVYDAFLDDDLGARTLYHGHSYGGNALAAAVALAHLQLIQSPEILDNVRARSEQLRTLLTERVLTLPPVTEFRLAGLMGAVELDTTRYDPLLPRRTCTGMVRRGVLSRSLGNVITLVPPLTTTAEEIEHVVDVLVAALTEAAAR